MDLYVVLGVTRGASVVEIKRAYRRLARRYHPDINPGDGDAAARFHDVLLAYETLTDPDRRRRYDAGQVEVSSVEARPFGFAGFDFSARVHGDRATTFGDLFAEAVGRHERRQAPRPESGADLHARVVVSFEQAWRGTTVPVTVTRQVACRACAGRGARPVAAATCPACQGAGSIRAARGHMVFTRACPGCGGAGVVSAAACDACQGLGVVTRAETRTVDLAPGVADGAHLCLAGRGHAGVRGGRPGDLHVDVHVESHPFYTRRGDDLSVVVPLAIHEAALGARVDVPTPDGAVRWRVPPGTQSGQRFRLSGRGAPSERDGRRGDLVIEARLVLPAVIDERSKDLLREFGKVNDENVRKHLPLGTE